MNTEKLTAGEIAKLFGISLRQLEHWRKIGLLSPSHRTAGGHSRYAEQDIRRARLIHRLLRHCRSVEAITPLLDGLCADVEEMVETACTRTAEDLLQAIRSARS